MNSIIPSMFLYLKVQGTVVSSMTGSRSSRDISRTMSPSPSSAFLGAGLVSDTLFLPSVPQQLLSFVHPQQLCNPSKKNAWTKWGHMAVLGPVLWPGDGSGVKCSVGRGSVT